MNLILVIGVVLCIAASIGAKREREGSDDRWKMRNNGSEEDKGNQRIRHGKQKHGPFKMFPSCKEFNGAFAQKMKQLKREKKIGSNTCEEVDRMNCFVKDRDITRCELKDEMTEECFQEITDFLQAAKCNMTEVSEI